MNCLVTAGPSYEPLDSVRRLTNSSTGRLGIDLTNYLEAQGHVVTLLLGELAIYRGQSPAGRIERFTTTTDLCSRMQTMASPAVDAIFHAAAVCDFECSKVWRRTAAGVMVELKERKLASTHDNLLIELAPTRKIIGELRDWYPKAYLVGWKYELDGDRPLSLARANSQISRNRTDACVVNGLAYGEGFGLVTAPSSHIHLSDALALFAALAQLLKA